MRATAKRTAGYAHTVEIEGGHTLVIDEPESSRWHRHRARARPGSLAAALAACTAITCEMYAERKGWDLGAVEVDVDIEYGRSSSDRARRP